MAEARKRPTRKAAAPKASDFRLDVETRFELTGRGTVSWFCALDPDPKYDKLGGKFYPDDTDRIGGVVADLLAEAQAQCDEAGVKVVQVDPIKTDKDGNNFYKIDRKSKKKDNSDVFLKFRDISGKNEIDLDDELGNGSIVNIKYYASAYYMAEAVTKVAGMPDIVVPARIGVSLSPLVIQVIDHKIYDGQGGDDFDDEAGEMPNSGTDSDEAPFDDATPKPAANDDY